MVFFGSDWVIFYFFGKVTPRRVTKPRYDGDIETDPPAEKEPPLTLEGILAEADVTSHGAPLGHHQSTSIPAI